jgi:hypothetical protein
VVSAEPRTLDCQGAGTAGGFEKVASNTMKLDEFLEIVGEDGDDFMLHEFSGVFFRKLIARHIYVVKDDCLFYFWGTREGRCKKLKLSELSARFEASPHGYTFFKETSPFDQVTVARPKQDEYRQRQCDEFTNRLSRRIEEIADSITVTALG